MSTRWRYPLALFSAAVFYGSATLTATADSAMKIRPPVDEYYQTVQNKSGEAFKTELGKIVSESHQPVTYAEVWFFFAEHSLDKYYEKDGTILDIYSENPSEEDRYDYRPTVDQCGTFSTEGDCYNREHSFPKSWFNGEMPMYADLHHMFATDGKVNGTRANHPYGIVADGAGVQVLGNGLKVGTGDPAFGFSGKVAEPIDVFKGDIARAQLYMALRYGERMRKEDWYSNSSETRAVLRANGAEPVYQEWYLNLMLKWHERDPVSAMERDRNEAIYQKQGNRNPFVDHPEWASVLYAAGAAKH